MNHMKLHIAEVLSLLQLSLIRRNSCCSHYDWSVRINEVTEYFIHKGRGRDEKAAFAYGSYGSINCFAVDSMRFQWCT